MAESELAEEIFQFEQQHQFCHWTLNQIEDALANEQVSYELYYEQEQLVGYVLAMRLVDMYEILQISVSPNYHRHGIGTALLKCSLAKAKALNCERMVLEVRKSNQKAIALYEKLGFVIDGYRKNYYASLQGNKEDAVLMSLTC